MKTKSILQITLLLLTASQTWAGETSKQQSWANWASCKLGLTVATEGSRPSSPATSEALTEPMVEKSNVARLSAKKRSKQSVTQQPFRCGAIQKNGYGHSPLSKNVSLTKDFIPESCRSDYGGFFPHPSGVNHMNFTPYSCRFSPEQHKEIARFYTLSSHNVTSLAQEKKDANQKIWMQWMKERLPNCAKASHHSKETQCSFSETDSEGSREAAPYDPADCFAPWNDISYSPTTWG